MWETRVPIHVRSDFYDVDGFVADADRGPRPWEAAVLGDVEGDDLTHLQCHFGMDTLGWARAGANVTGLDFSPTAVATATSLAEQCGLEGRARFVCADVLAAADALGDDTADVVYVSLGALCWLPSVERWAAQVGRILRPGGRLFVHDVHPLSSALDDDGERVRFGMFSAAGPVTWTEAYTYTDTEPEEAVPVTTSHEWVHGIGEIVSAVLGRGLVLRHLEEHPWTSWSRFPWLVREDDQRWSLPADRPQIPLSFTLLATAPL